MKNEPIIAYNHLQEEQSEKSHSHADSHESGKRTWRILLNPYAIAIEVTAIVVMLILMIEELLH